MRATLEFDLPEDRDAFRGACHAENFWCALFDMDQHLRGLQKYAPDLEEKEMELVDKLREHLWEILREHNITLEEYS